MKSDLLNLTEEQRGIRDLAREFAHNEIAPYIAQWDEDAHFEPSIIKKMGDLGFLGMLIPEEFEGLGVDTSTYLLALEEIAAVDASTAVLMSVHNSLPTQMILRFGTDEQKKRFLPAMARGEILGAFALSEPEAGSDAASLTTQAVRDGDSWILNGTKSWVTSGSHAGAIITMARTDTASDRKGPRGIGAFIVTPDLEGFHVGKKEDKLGLRSSPTVQLNFDNLRVPDGNLLGQPHMGFVYAMQSLENGRLGIAAQAIGIARAALEAATAYSAERHQFDRPIREFQAIQFKLADMATRVAASRTLLHAAARAKDRGENVKQASSMAKLFASETAMFATNQAVQIFGGYGYVKDYPVERLFRDAKVTEIYEGTSEIQRIVIAREQFSHE
ncbi:MAG TPA: acyl-CoA dehydrogenase family protein [Gemmatimonadaceae bacterium]|jgi:alkylation response protein AidB-like acyl-CoA dehydrogenase|nr:acyl-CoA dehydrogenase family protein [Gemmatimonadaceae bacterium]